MWPRSGSRAPKTRTGGTDHSSSESSSTNGSNKSSGNHPDKTGKNKDKNKDNKDIDMSTPSRESINAPSKDDSPEMVALKQKGEMAAEGREQRLEAKLASIKAKFDDAGRTGNDIN